MNYDVALSGDEYKAYLKWYATDPRIPPGKTTLQAFKDSQKKTGQLSLGDF